MKYRFVNPKQKKKSILSSFSLKSVLNGPGVDQGLIFALAGLILFGWVMVYSSSALFAESRYHDQYFFLKKQIMWSVIGVFSFAMAVNIPLTQWQKAVPYIYLGTVFFLLMVLAMGPKIAGARRWLRLAGFSFQPSELAKLAIIFVTADYLDRRQSRLRDFKKGFLPLLILVGIPISLILVEPDLGTPVLISTVFLFLLILGGARWKHLIFVAIATLPVLLIALFKVRYRLARLFAYLNPWENAQGVGYQLVQSLLAMGSGGIFGRGLGESRIKISNLPDAHTDFIFSVLGEELGLIGTLSCVALFFFLCFRGLRIAKKAPTTFSMLLAAGISLMIGLQAIINMGVASGLLPTKGMPLPFISFGGSSLLLMMTSVGLLANISRLPQHPLERSK